MIEPQISVIIPTQNMSEYLDPLLESLRTSGTAPLIKEVIVINDGSTDGTGNFLQRKLLEPFWQDCLRIISNSTPKGRFEVRKQGALSARGTLVFFVDSRVVLTPGQGEKLRRLLQTQDHLMGMPEIDEAKSVFNLYWKRSHQFIFRKHFREVRQGISLTIDNYEEYAKGTTLLLVPRENFLKACGQIGSANILADDTLLLREIVQMHPLFISDQLTFNWEPRQTWKEFLHRIFERGPSFVQYHFLATRTRFFYAFLISLFMLGTILWGSLHLESSPWPGLFCLLGLGALSVLMMTRNPREALRLLPIHILVLSTFSVAIFYGIIYCSFHQNTRALGKS